MGQLREVMVERSVALAALRDQKWEEEHQDAEMRLYGSDVGGCVRKAYLAAMRYDMTHPFDEYLFELFELGYDTQERVARAIRNRYNGLAVEEFKVGNDVWAARIDFLIDRCNNYPEGAIYEIKGTSHWNFGTKEPRLPYEHHVHQVLLQQRLLLGQEGKYIPAYIYYTNWNMWGEFLIQQGNGFISWMGEINGHEVEGSINGSIGERAAEFERWWPTTEPPPIPYATYDELDFGCTKKTRKGLMVACPYYGHCWENEP